MVATPALHRQSGPSEEGFTLVELLLALVVSMAVVGGATLLAGQMQSSYRAQLEAATAQQEGRYALQQIERVLRGAGNNPYRLDTTDCPSSGTPVDAVILDPNGDGQHNDIRVMMDANPTNGLLGGVTGACDEVGEDVTISLNTGSNTVWFTDNIVASATRPLTDTVVTGLQFVYRDPLRGVTTDPDNVAFIETQITVQSRINDLSLGTPLTYTLSSEVRVRTR